MKTYSCADSNVVSHVVGLLTASVLLWGLFIMYQGYLLVIISLSSLLWTRWSGGVVAPLRSFFYSDHAPSTAPTRSIFHFDAGAGFKSQFWRCRQFFWRPTETKQISQKTQTALLCKAMTTVDKLLIQGIRSFSPNKRNTIEFYSPLTIIVGQNGAGKTVPPLHLRPWITLIFYSDHYWMP